NLLVDHSAGDASLTEDLRGDPPRGFEQAQQQVLGPDVVVAERTRVLVRGAQGGSGPLGESLERGLREGEALVRGLLGDAERAADLRPGVPAPPALVDEVPEHRITALFELGPRPGGGREPV